MIVAGFGFRRAATCASFEGALRLAQDGLPTIEALAVPDDKRAAFALFADTLGLPIIAISADALAAADTATRSAPSIAARRTGSVAEAAALAAAGEGAVLLGARHISPDRLATCAIARGACP
ncbi:cobalamin biosynthesis protein [uncultured Sphingomonas sp.]|uniref:cobalamin biosynthesis protein n=1 Tax=uncultured Sphingomonas sp. TaxID=158754 RepID=UPI0026032EC5|nr:cobalamin biosynthesis protein [uncultured Sphingomonas sp.]